MSIHAEHPFMPDDQDRDPVRRFRGRVGGTVSLWTTGTVAGPHAGLTVSSYLVAAGEPARLVALVDPDSDLADALAQTPVAVVHLLGWRHRQLADVFAGQFPAPGGPFRTAGWQDTPWGPRLADATTWAGVRLVDGATRRVGWSELVEAVIERVEVGPDEDPLVHRRGRYQPPAG